MSALTTYAPLAGSRFASTEQAQYFIMNALLYSRMEAGYPSNREFFDEDVNVYLANLLVSRIDPSPGAVPDAVACADAALFEDAAARGDRARYELYRGCADALLVSLGIFRNARGRRPSSASRIAPPARTYIGRGKTYYAIASSLAATLARRGNAVADVLGKLSRGFERYLAVLSHLGGEHFGIVAAISDGTLYHLERSTNPALERSGAAEAYDRFLDQYSAYRRDPTPRGKHLLADAARAVREFDPSFAFDLDSLDGIKSL